MDGIKDLLLNILFLLVPIFTYQTFWGDKMETVSPTPRHRGVFAVLSSISTILCMTFPVYNIPGFVLDLRLIPMLFAFLYGGYRVGVITTLVMFAYRIYIGGFNSGFFYMLWSFPLQIIVVCFFVSRFRTYSRKGKMTALTFLTLPQLIGTAFFIIARTQVPFYKNEYLSFFTFFIVVHICAIWLCAYLIENMRERIALRSEIRRAEKLQVLGDLAASIAHEIRNPMTVVRGFLQLLQENQIPKEKQHLFLKMGIEELDRSETIISNYLSFARPQVEKEVRINLTERIDHCVGIISSFATLHNVVVHKNIQPNLFVTGDPEKLSQVLINLIKNGIEAMPDGGTIEIVSSLVHQDVQIQVIDSGIGMSAEEVSRIGDPYFSTKEKGTGLGLMVSFRIIQSMQGNVQVKSEKGKGTQFTISLPALLAE